MKVLFIHPHDLLYSPWTIRMIKLADAIQQKGHCVEILFFEESCRRRKGYKTFEQKNLPVPATPLHKYHLLENVMTIRRKLKEFDILHIQKCLPHAVVPALVAAYVTGTPIHYDWDDYEEGITRESSSGTLFTRLVSLFEKKMPLLVDSVSVSSSALYDRLIASGFTKERAGIVPVGVDTALFNPSVAQDTSVALPLDHGPVICYAGQLESAHSAFNFVRIAPHIINSCNDALFLIIGGGIDQSDIQDLIKKYDLMDNFVLTGYVMHWKMPSLINLADVCVIPMDDNPLNQSKSPLKLLEFMAMAKPVVASRVGEIPVMLGNAGLITSPGNSKETAQAILELLNNKEKGAALGKKARLIAQSSYSWSEQGEKLVDLYRTIVSREFLIVETEGR